MSLHGNNPIFNLEPALDFSSSIREKLSDFCPELVGGYWTNYRSGPVNEEITRQDSFGLWERVVLGNQLLQPSS
jgi:hypothetical protein